MQPQPYERISTGIRELDAMMSGGIPRGFMVAVTGEPGTGKTVLCIHYIAQGIRDGDHCIYVTTEESRDSLIRQAAQFGFDFSGAIRSRRLIMVDALTGGEDPWSLKSLDMEELVNKILEAKRALGFGRARLVIDSLSAFWLDQPAMARRHSYFAKKVLGKWDMTTIITSQYAITTSDAFGFGVEHIADGIIRFRRTVREGILRRYLLIEKMRQTNHSIVMHEVTIVDGKGLVILSPVQERREDLSLPRTVMEKITSAREAKEREIP